MNIIVIDEWRDLTAGGFDVRLVPENTITMWREPHVQSLADQLKASFDEAPIDSKGSIDAKNKSVN